MLIEYAIEDGGGAPADVGTVLDAAEVLVYGPPGKLDEVGVCAGVGVVVPAFAAALAAALAAAACDFCLQLEPGLVVLIATYL